ncbi:MAG: hypothetical protein ACRDIX_04725 [Actinomycetota bacterium]
MKRIAVIVGVALLGGACARAPVGGSGATLIPQGGEVHLQNDGVWRTVSDAVPLARGDRVEIRGFGRASVELPGGTLELRQGSTLRIGAVPELEKGSVLAQAISGLSVGIGPVQVSAAETSLYRVDRLLSVRVGVYQGEVSLPGSGWGGTVSALRQVGLVGGTVPRGPVALQVDPGDPWDDRLLGDAVDVGERLERLQEGVALQLPRRGGRAAVAAVIPLDRRMILAGLPERAAAGRLSEALVASVVASAAGPARDVSPERAFSQVMALRGLGASWIVVAAEWNLARSILGTLVRQVTALLTTELAPSTAAPGAAGVGGGTGGGSPGTGGGPSGGGTGSGGTVDEPTEPAPPEPACLDLLTCTVEDVLDTDIGDDLLLE